MEKNELLPDGWVETNLENICSINSGQSPPSSTYNSIKDGLPFFQGNADFGELYPNTRIWCSSPKKTAEKNDLLLSVRAPVGETNISKEKCCIGRGLAAIRPLNENMEIKFFIHFFRFVKNDLDSIGTGTTFKAISGKQIRDLKITLPPLNEQKRIIEKIEEVFSIIDNLKIALSKLSIQLKHFRQSILQYAFEGQLTKEWRIKNPNIHGNSRWNLNLEPIIDSSLPEIPNNWCWRKLEQISNGVVVAFVGPTTKHYVDESKGVMFLRSQNVRKGKMNFNGLKYVEHSFHEKQKKSQIKPNNLLIVRVGANRGDSCIVPNCITIANAGNIIIAKVFEDMSPLLNYFFQTDFCQKQLLGMTTGSAQGVINTTSVSHTLIPIVPIEEQNELIKKLEDGFSLVSNTENLITSMNSRLERLQSITLKQAFEGKLVPQDPNDEPASELLKRIKNQ